MRSPKSRPYSTSNRLTRGRPFAGVLVAALFCGLGAVTNEAQSISGNSAITGAVQESPRKAAGKVSHLYGHVVDPEDAALVSALVTITNEQTKEVHPVATDEEGNFRVLLSGDYSYELRVEYPGFTQFVYAEINLRAAGDTRWDVEMRMGPPAAADRVKQYQQPLVRAAHNEELRQIRRLLQGGADVNQAEDDGTTALHLAVLAEREDIIETLVKGGANPNAVNERGENILFLLDDHGDTDYDRFVLGLGADVNQVDQAGNTPLIRFAQWNEDDRLQFFVDSGANLDARNAEGNTALMVAAAKGNDRAVKVLLQAGANRSLHNAVGKTALELALASDDEWTIDLLRAAGTAPRSAPKLPQNLSTPVHRED